jgi:hypothetical protein
MAPPGENLNDGTNTRLDDNIRILEPGSYSTPGTGIELVGAKKRQLLGWRGFPNSLGTYVDDQGNPTDIGANEGDIRPSPTLMPVPFNAKSRVRSKWIDTGSSQRRPIAAADGLPRGLVTATGAEVGPRFEFAGTDITSIQAGYIDYEVIGQSVRVRYPTAVGATPMVDIDSDASYLGSTAYRIRLGDAVLGEDNRYASYQAELINTAGSVLVGYRILSHTADEMVVEPTAGLIPSTAVAVQVRAKFFKVVTNGAEGLGPTYSEAGGAPIPVANVRIGFAFHQDPDPSDLLNGRYPDSSLQDFVRDMNDPGLQAWIAANGHPRYIQWDVIFDMAYKPGPAVPPALTPSTPQPQLDFLRIPFRF